MKKLAAIAASIGVLALPAAAFAGDFGPGNSNKGPQDPGARCHPPGQTSDRPECS